VSYKTETIKILEIHFRRPVIHLQGEYYRIESKEKQLITKEEVIRIVDKYRLKKITEAESLKQLKPIDEDTYEFSVQKHTFSINSDTYYALIAFISTFSLKHRVTMVDVSNSKVALTMAEVKQLVRLYTKEKLQITKGK